MNFPTLKKNTIEDSVGSIVLFHEFFTADYTKISNVVKKMKEAYGGSLKWGTLVTKNIKKQRNIFVKISTIRIFRYIYLSLSIDIVKKFILFK